jgi:hypothetical protein
MWTTFVMVVEEEWICYEKGYVTRKGWMADSVRLGLCG